MTVAQKQLVKDLMDGHFLCKRGNCSGGLSFGLYRDNMILVRKVNPGKQIGQLLKRDRFGRYTLNLSSVRQLHGKNTIKKFYKAKNSPNGKEKNRS